MNIESVIYINKGNIPHFKKKKCSDSITNVINVVLF